TSEYAEAGTLAHSVCEIKARRKFMGLTSRSATAQLNKLKKDPLYDPEMERTSDVYIETLSELSMLSKNPPYVELETRVDFSEYVPDGFGTCDCLMVGGRELTIVDYKHGKGIPVSAMNNPQLRLYALGAINKLKPFYGDTIQLIRVMIVQPRNQHAESFDTLSIDELLRWGETIKPIAQKAFSGFGDFVPGEHCRFCRGKAQCRARAEAHTALEDFKDFVTPKQTESQPASQVLSNDEIGELLVRGKSLVDWYKSLEEYAHSAVLGGEKIAGWKLVEGRSVRSFSDADKALEEVIKAGYDESIVYERKPKSLSELEKMMGKAAFAVTVGDLVIKPPGKPTLVEESDKRPPYSSAKTDFAELISDEK
ncbi:MAG: DUF2800 domain-containing protein, partial [Oscillospiraceae bacterium]|nr:DUF2800 domain-containing protein [Oscillospiraceae bacterium]